MSSSPESPAPLAPPSASAAPPLNARQRNVLIGGVVVALLMGLFPPWCAAAPSIGFHTYREFDLGYRPIVMPPDPAARLPALAGRSAAIDVPVLVFQWVATAAVTAGLYFALATRAE
jgi:hypothetical protein